MPVIFRESVMTEAGASLLNKAIAGECSIEFTRMATGSGTYTEEEKAVIVLQQKTALKHEEQSFNITSTREMTQRCVEVKAVLTNTGLQNSYYINEIGLFAQEQGDDTTEVLYGIAVVDGGTGELMPIDNGRNPVNIIQSYYITVDNSADITIRPGSEVFALAEDVGSPSALNTTDKSNLVAAINETLANEGDLSELDTTEKTSLVGAINENFGNFEVFMREWSIMKREQMASYGYFGEAQDLDEVMAHVGNGDWDKFAIGDYFDLTNTNNEKIRWEIASKNGYKNCGDQGDGLTKNNIILCPRDCLATKYKYNSSNTNSGGYAGSLMPANMEAEYAKLPATLKAYVQEVRRLENNKGNWAWASRKVLIPSVLEILGHHGWADYYDGTPVCHSLELFTGGNAHHMKGQGFNKSVAARMWYWLADPSSANTTYFCGFGIYGGSSGSGASYEGGVAPLIVLANNS